jgi:hypothetical protein
MKQVIQLSANITIFATEKKIITMELLHDIIAFLSIFAIISSGTMIILQKAICIYTHKKEMSERMESVVVISGIIMAIMMIPFYYYQ